MTNADLNRILELHQKWLNNEDGGERANLYCADLSGADLSSADLRGAILCGADLSRADLSGAKNIDTVGEENDPEIITNADRIRDMSDEELAQFIFELYEQPLGDGYLQWLQQPAEEDTE